MPTYKPDDILDLTEPTDSKLIDDVVNTRVLIRYTRQDSSARSKQTDSGLTFSHSTSVTTRQRT